MKHTLALVSGDDEPACSLQQLADPAFKVEIEAIAVLP